MKIRTTVYIDENLAEQGRARNFNFSELLEDTLRLNLDLPKNQKDLNQEINELNARLSFLQSNEHKVQLEAQNIQKLSFEEQKQKDVDILRKAKTIFINDNTTGPKYNRILRAFAEKYNLELSSVVAIAEDRKKF